MMQFMNSAINNKGILKRIISLVLFFTVNGLSAQQWIDYNITPRGDTINRVDKQKRKQGPWVLRYEEVRGEPGFEEQGYFVDGKKEGAWRKFNLEGDQIAKEFFKWGYKDGKQQYYTQTGDLYREESWKAVNPENPYDTIMVPDLNNPDIMIEKIIKHESAEVKNGIWTFYVASTGAVAKTEKYIFGQLEKNSGVQPNIIKQNPVVKPKDSILPKKVLPKELQVLDKSKKAKGKG
jgi:hypothetical protein